MATYGPVITAIEAGHVEHGGSCRRCTEERLRLGTPEKAEFPCQVIVRARAQQKVYAERVRTERAIAAGKLSSLEAR